MENIKLDSFDEIKLPLSMHVEIGFWYKNLLWYIGPDKGKKWLIYANKQETMGNPIIEHTDVADPYKFDFGDGKHLEDIWEDIIPEFNI